MTRTEEIDKLLRQKPWTPEELCDHFGAPMLEIMAELGHVKRKVQSPHVFKRIPPKCQKCGFLFKEQSGVKPISKCPICNSEDIEEGKYFIRN